MLGIGTDGDPLGHAPKERDGMVGAGKVGAGKTGRHVACVRPPARGRVFNEVANEGEPGS